MGDCVEGGEDGGLEVGSCRLRVIGCLFCEVRCWFYILRWWRNGAGGCGRAGCVGVVRLVALLLAQDDGIGDGLVVVGCKLVIIGWWLMVECDCGF